MAGFRCLPPMSEVAGRLAIEAAGAALNRYAGGQGLLIGDVPGVQPLSHRGDRRGRCWHSRCKDGRMLGRRGHNPRPFLSPASRLDELFEGHIRTRFSTIDSVEEKVFAADVVIGAVLILARARPNLSAAAC